MDMTEQSPVTQEDVARRAGVSCSVVSYVLNNGPRKVSEATRQRVLDAINDLEYRPNEYAQRLKQGGDAAQNSIGIVIGGKSYNLIERPYYNIMLSVSMITPTSKINKSVFWHIGTRSKTPYSSTNIFTSKKFHRSY
jgi:transcriptional regulator with XRE-family HTH domain